MNQIDEAVAVCAYYNWLDRVRQNVSGTADDDWFRAEAHFGLTLESVVEQAKIHFAKRSRFHYTGTPESDWRDARNTLFYERKVQLAQQRLSA